MVSYQGLGAPRSLGRTDSGGGELGSGSSGKGMGEPPVPVSLPEDTAGHSGPGEPPPSRSEELSRCCL